MPHEPDPVLKNARREAIDHRPGLARRDDLLLRLLLPLRLRSAEAIRSASRTFRPILGMPSWVFWGVLVPWLVCAVFTFWFAGFFMADDDLGKDHTPSSKRTSAKGASMNKAEPRSTPSRRP